MFTARQEYVPILSSVMPRMSNSFTILPLDWKILVVSISIVSLALFVNVHNRVGRGIPLAEQLKVMSLPCSSDMLSRDFEITGTTISKKIK